MAKHPAARMKKRRAGAASRNGAGGALRLVFPQKRIQNRVHEIATQINRDYKGQTLHVVGILENCFLFMADLVRALKMPVICHFMKAVIRDTREGRVAIREIMYTPRIEANGKHILLVDGILQSGVTLDHLVRYMLGQNPSSVRTALFIEKVDERKVAVATDYVAFRSTQRFLVGYGLGLEDKYRHLPYVARLG